MSDRYGKTRVAKIKAAYDDLREAVRAHDTEAAEAALDRYEQWADYVFQPSKADAERDALREALKVTSAILQAEMYRSGGEPFSGTWRIPALQIRATCHEALDQANAALNREPDT